MANKPDSLPDPSAVPALSLAFAERTAEEFVTARAPEVSRRGMFVAHEHPWATGSLLRFECLLADGQRVMHGVARVSWTRPLPDEAGPAGMGLKFVKLDSTSRGLIERMVQARGGSPSAFDRGAAPQPGAGAEDDVGELLSSVRRGSDHEAVRPPPTARHSSAPAGPAAPAPEHEPDREQALEAALFADITRPSIARPAEPLALESLALDPAPERGSVVESLPELTELEALESGSDELPGARAAPAESQAPESEHDERGAPARLGAALGWIAGLLVLGALGTGAYLWWSGGMRGIMSDERPASAPPAAGSSPATHSPPSPAAVPRDEPPPTSPAAQREAEAAADSEGGETEGAEQADEAAEGAGDAALPRELWVRTVPPGARVTVRERTWISPARIELEPPHRRLVVHVFRDGYHRVARAVPPEAFEREGGRAKATLTVRLRPEQRRGTAEDAPEPAADAPPPEDDPPAQPADPEASHEPGEPTATEASEDPTDQTETSQTQASEDPTDQTEASENPTDQTEASENPTDQTEASENPADQTETSEDEPAPPAPNEDESA